MSTSPEAEFNGPLVGGRYRMGRRLGSGGQGSAHLALDEKTGKRVAVKAFELAKVKDWKELDLFRRECRVLKDVRHTGIPEYLDELESEDHKVHYLVMEYVPGQSLKERVRDGALTEAELWRLLWQMVNILDYLHGRQPPVVHRDIKPANLIQRPDGDVALVDFGVVQTGRPATGGNTFVGTYGFMAPEQFHGEASTATDIYALGATLICLGTGCEPEDLPHEGLRLKFKDRLRVSDELLTLLERLTEPEPAKRPTSGVELKKELEARSNVPSPTRRSRDDEEPLHQPRPGELPAPVGVAVGALLTLIGTLGMVALTVVDAVLVPLIFTLLAMSAPREKKRRLQNQQDHIHGALKAGVRTFQQLSTGGYQAFRQHQRELKSARQEALPGRRERRLEREKWREEERRRAAAMKARNRHGGRR
ncbi:MAG: serine/threonine-protein kinase [Myxococcota bacterium]